MSKVKKLVKKAKHVVQKVVPKEIAPILPAAVSFIPGVGTVAGAALGAGVGALTNKNSLKGALLGGLSGGLASGGGAAISKGLGLSGTAGAALSRGLTGAATGANKGIKGALLGGALGAGSAYLPAGLGGAGGSTTGGSALAGAGRVLTGAGMQGPTQSGASLDGNGGLLGIGKSILGLGGSGGVGTGLGLGATLAGSLLGKGAIAAGDYNAYNAQDDAEERMLAAQAEIKKMLQPYADLGTKYTGTVGREIDSGALGGTFDAEDFTASPGYEFRKAEGEKALGRALAASGMSQSGAAIRRALELNQDMASSEFDNAYDRWQQDQERRYGMLTGQQGVGLTATGGMADTVANVGNIGANARINKANTLSQALANLFGPKYDEFGNPVYG